MYTDKQILRVLRAAKESYNLIYRTRSGMCGSIAVAFENLHDVRLSYLDLPKIIEGFNPEYLGGENTGFWWPPSEVEVRLKAFDKLIWDYEQKTQNPVHNIMQYIRLLISKLNIFK